MISLTLAVEFNGDQISLINFLGLLVCLSGITSHVIHKIRNPIVVKPPNFYEENESLELGEPLISEKTELIQETSDEEQSDTQELFNILHSRDR